MADDDRQRWARVKPDLVHKLPGAPKEWVRVLSTPPRYTRGYVLLDCRPGRPLREWAEHLEFRESEPRKD
jgi:hypothetical protein